MGGRGCVGEEECDRGNQLGMILGILDSQQTLLIIPSLSCLIVSPPSPSFFIYLDLSCVCTTLSSFSFLCFISFYYSHLALARSLVVDSSYRIFLGSLFLVSVHLQLCISSLEVHLCLDVGNEGKRCDCSRKRFERFRKCSIWPSLSFWDFLSSY